MSASVDLELRRRLVLLTDDLMAEARVAKGTPEQLGAARANSEAARRLAEALGASAPLSFEANLAFGG